MVVRDAGPACGATPCKKTGHLHRGKPPQQCPTCGRPCVARAEARLMADEQRTRIEHLRRERLARRGLCRAVGVSLPWLLHGMVERCAAWPEHLHAQLPVSPTDVVMRQLEAEAAAMWSWVQQTATTPWIWSAMDANTRQIMAFHVGDRRGDRAQHLWAKLPWVSREQATCQTDHDDASPGVRPAERHSAMTKSARTTNHIERGNTTRRQRISRLLRDTRSFSKTLAHHIGAITYFICHDNLARTAALSV